MAKRKSQRLPKVSAKQYSLPKFTYADWQQADREDVQALALPSDEPQQRNWNR